MEKKIKKYLQELEVEKNIEILFACETGSRAWGFPSPDSDYDVRIIYRHPKEWYLSLKEGKDSIDCFYEDNEIDISGWELRKCLRLLSKSNPPLLERIQSPIIYKIHDDFQQKISSIAPDFYARIATIYHYSSMGKKILSEIIDTKEYKLKKLFYALRSSVACLWILEKETSPPIEFEKMLGALDIPQVLKERIHQLIDLKSVSNESYLHTGDRELLQFIKFSLEKADANAKDLPGAKGDFSKLDLFFRNYLPL